MKAPAVLLAALALATASWAQPVPPPIATLAADPELQAFWQVADQRFPRSGPGEPFTREQLLARDAAAQKAFELGRAWMEQHPVAPERYWVVLVLAERSPPRYIREIKPGYENNPESEEMLVCDDARRQAAADQVRTWLSALRRDASAPPRFRGEASFIQLRREIPTAKTRADVDRLQREVEQLLGSAEALERQVGHLYHLLAEAYASYGTAVLESYLQLLESRPNETVRQVATQARAKLEQQRTRVDWIKFTALDGREVDLAKLRGKVVLVDFGATWCLPCIAEIPGMLEAYRKYHDHGFEVIGLSLEEAGVIADDPPERAQAKVAAARKKLASFIQKQGIPWPVYFDSRGLQNEFCARLGITSIPAMFLIDQDGNVVNTAARGAALEREVRRLLKL